MKNILATVITLALCSAALAQSSPNIGGAMVPNTNSGGPITPSQLPANAIWIGRQTFCASGCTAAGGVYAPTAGTNEINARCVGGGGGGGGAAVTTVAQIAEGGGGGGGGYVEARITAAFSGVTITPGAAGAAGVAGANAGGTGGNTTFGVLLTASGGAGGGAGAAAAAGGTVGGAAGGNATGGDINVIGNYSLTLIYATLLVAQGGQGANGIWGAGGPSSSGTGSAAGSAGLGYGAGGSGGINGASQAAAVAGGAGSPGKCVVDEYR
jgi:hypothetical protein